MRRRLYDDSDDDASDKTCFIGQQAIVAFLGCLCGNMGVLLLHTWLYTTITIYCGVSWGMFTISSLDNNKRQLFKSTSWIILFFLSSFAIVVLVSWLFLDTKNFITILIVSILSTFGMLCISEYLYKYFKLYDSLCLPTCIKTSDDDV